MPINLRGRSLLTLAQLSPREIEFLLSLARNLKQKKQCGVPSNLLTGKNVALIFNKPSTRTRCAFETAIATEGGHVSFLTNFHMGHKESITDTAKVLGRYYDGIGFRGYHHAELEGLADHTGIPVWNGLTDQYHPTQVLADLMTVQEYIDKPWSQIKWVYVGDGRNNMARSLMIGAAKIGINFTNLAPKKLWPSLDFLKIIDNMASISQAHIKCDDNIETAVKNADVIYTDVWVSMGEETEWQERIDLLKNYQVNNAMLEKTHNKNAVFMHCLPAFHDTQTEVGQKIKTQFGLDSMEVTDAVFQSSRSLVFEQSENRLHTIKAVVVATIGNI